MQIEKVLEKAREIGFEDIGVVNVPALQFMPEVRDMCKSGRCRVYGKSWSCPPACGTIEEAAEKASAFTQGVLVQSVGHMEDEFDGETMMDTEDLQKTRFAELTEWLRGQGVDCLPMAAGTCRICKKCTYPDAPCRFPEKMYASMEAYGLWVSKVCEQAGRPYNHGKLTIAFVGCVLF